MHSIFKNAVKTLCILSLFTIVSCNDDDATPNFDIPATYSFERDGQSTVSFDGQTTRIRMAEELSSGMLNFDLSEATLQEMYINETAGGGDANPFSTTELNESTKSIRSKVAASADFFSANTATAADIKSRFASYITQQVDIVYPARNLQASEGVSGQIADGTSTRYINDFGLEYNQLVSKSLIGALMVDQILNNYLSTAVLDEADNRTKNDAETVEDGKPYTTMEHKWDEAYGYVYGNSQNPAEPNLTIGEDDSFLNKYISRVEDDADFRGIADDIFEAFKTGRAAIVAGDYDERDAQANIIRKKISEVIAIRAVYYLQAGKTGVENGVEPGTIFHDLSEGLGFVYSLQFTRKPNSDEPYFTKTEAEEYFSDIIGDINGLWNVDVQVLEDISEAIAGRFDFTVAEAR